MKSAMTVHTAIVRAPANLPDMATTHRDDAAPPAPSQRAIWVLAIALAALLTLGRTIADWPYLSILRLPDNDDMMRLAEVRDWIGGQNFHDLMQHRLGLPPVGASMHWSRIADAGPALLLLMFQPLLGAKAGTLATVILYQGVLLCAYLLLAARNARLLIGTRAMVPAVIFAALAFPTIPLFAPGRIDHHALQIVLTMVVVGPTLSPPSWRAGLAGGLAAALSLAIGLEVAPELMIAFAILCLQWLIGGRAETPRLAGLAVALGATTLALLWFARPIVWPGEWCDGFTPASTGATLGASVALAALALAGERWSGSPARAAVAAIAGAAVASWSWHSAHVCLSGPYGAMTPFLKHAFMDNVGEARELFFVQNTWGTCLAYGGLSLAALVALALVMRDSATRRRWWPIAVFLALSAIVLILQIRVSYILAGIATLPFVALMVRARATDRGLGVRLAIWLAGAGMIYNLAGLVLDALFVPSPRVAAERAVKACLDGGPLLALAGLPVGNVMAPLDSGAYVIGMTPHRSFAAPYHRNNDGNTAMYRFFLSPPPVSAAMARALDVTYVVACQDSMEEVYLERFRRGSLIDALQTGHRPAWLTPVAHDRGGMTVYRVNLPH